MARSLHRGARGSRTPRGPQRRRLVRMFRPPRCPNSTCPAHQIETFPDPEFYRHIGFYHPKCRARPVPRFQCKECGRGFSRQTFRQDYCDNKPHLNAKLFDLLCSGIGLRQSGRTLKISRRCTELKARKISRHLGRLGHNGSSRSCFETAGAPGNFESHSRSSDGR